MATLRKGDLGTLVAAKLGTSRAQGDAAVNAVIAAVQGALVSGDRVVITGFGAFEVRNVKERQVRPIRGGPGSQQTIPAHKRVGFSAGTELNQTVQGKRS